MEGYCKSEDTKRPAPMATTYLSAAAAAAAAANYHHYEQDSATASAAAAVAMNLVNNTGGASGGYCSPRDSMHEMKYNPPISSSNTPPASGTSVVTSPLHNGHPLAHNPWGLPTHDPWAMHPAHGLYSASTASSVADLKPQDIKPHSPGDFNSVRAQVQHMANPWQHPPVSSPYLSMPQTASTPVGAPPLAPNSPSPHPYGLNGMPHPYVDRYSRESHNSSPRSGTDEDPMQPTSGTHTGTALELTTFFINYLLQQQQKRFKKNFLLQKYYNQILYIYLTHVAALLPSYLLRK